MVHNIEYMLHDLQKSIYCHSKRGQQIQNSKIDVTELVPQTGVNGINVILVYNWTIHKT